MQKSIKEIIEKVDNLIIRKALNKRIGRFMFNYGDEASGRHTDELKSDSPKKYNDAWKKPYKDHKDYTEYNDYSEDNYFDAYV